MSKLRYLIEKGKASNSIKETTVVKTLCQTSLTFCIKNHVDETVNKSIKGTSLNYIR